MVEARIEVLSRAITVPLFPQVLVVKEIKRAVILPRTNFSALLRDHKSEKLASELHLLSCTSLRGRTYFPRL